MYFYNYGWIDYGVPTLKSVLDMVKVVDFATCEGKVAIHCHAGLGRTGVLIACYLIYSKRMGGDEAIATVREKRYNYYYNEIMSKNCLKKQRAHESLRWVGRVPMG